MLMNMSVERAKPTNYSLPRDSGAGSDKAQKLSTTIERVFQEHQAKLGSKTLMSIAWCLAGVQH